MEDQNLVKFYISIFCLLTLSAFYNSSHAAEEAKPPVGQVILVTGEHFKAIQADKTERPLTRRASIFKGDILETGANTTAQIRFKDDAVISFQPNTRISIDEYSDRKAGDKEDKSVSTLLKGGFRTITGKIAERNPDNYQVKTPVAIIGVRGTNYSALLVGIELFVTAWQGELILSNHSGLIQIGTKEKFKHAVVSNEEATPEGLVNIPKEISGDSCSAPRV